MAPDGVIIPYTATNNKGKRQEVNTMPEQVPTKSDGNGKIVAYKREDVNTFPVQQASMAPDGVIIPYTATNNNKGKRQAVNTMPEQVATKSDENGKIVAYVKREDVNTFPVQQASMAPDGVIIPYTATNNKGKRQEVNTMPEQVPAKSDGNGKIVAYKREDVNTFPVQQASMAPDGVIIPYTATNNKVKRQEVNTMPEQIATKSDGNGKIVAYKRADVNTFPVQQASMAPDGVIVAYSASEKSQ